MQGHGTVPVGRGLRLTPGGRRPCRPDWLKSTAGLRTRTTGAGGPGGVRAGPGGDRRPGGVSAATRTRPT